MPMPMHTSVWQDREIEAASKVIQRNGSSEEAIDCLQNLISIINSLDVRVGELMEEVTKMTEDNEELTREVSSLQQQIP